MKLLLLNCAAIFVSVVFNSFAAKFLDMRWILMLLVIMAAGEAVAQQRMSVIAIASYNCENLFDTLDNPEKKDDDFTPGGAYGYNSAVYVQKLHNIASVIQKLGKDMTPDGAAIVGLVEVENSRVLQDLVSQPELRDRHYQFCWFPTPDERGISTAMLFNPRYFSVLNARPVTVPLYTIGMMRPTRSILYVTGVLAGDTVHIMVNHWPSKSGGEAATAPGRRLAATVVRGMVDSISTAVAGARVIIMGDLNDNPDAPSVLEDMKAKEDAKFVGVSDIYNPWIRMYKKGLGTENYRGEWGLIDQVMMTGSLVHSPKDKWHFYKAEIFNRDFLTQRLGDQRGLPHRSFTAAQVWDNGYSDHFPVLIYLVKERN